MTWRGMSGPAQVPTAAVGEGGASPGWEPVLKKGVGTLTCWCLEEFTVPEPPSCGSGQQRTVVSTRRGLPV